MMFHPHALHALLLLATPLQPDALARARLDLAPDTVHTDASGTADILGGLRFDTGRVDPGSAALAFVRAYGAAMGLQPQLKVGHITHVGDRAVVRLHEELDGVPVLGGGVAVMVNNGVVEMAMRGERVVGRAPQFVLSPKEAAAAAWKHRPAFVASSRTVADLTWLARKAFVAGKDGLRPVWRFRLESVVVGQGVEVMVDARDGTLVSRLALATSATAPGKVYDPNPGVNGTATPVDVTLQNLTDGQPNLTGDFVEVYNCCKRVECITQGDGGCAEQRCVAYDEPADAGVPARVAFSLPVAALPIPEQYRAQIALVCPNLPDPVYINSAFCGVVHKATNAGSGFVYEPKDVTQPRDQALASEEDNFAEVMAYHHVNRFQTHVRDLLADPTWCLSSQGCTAGAPSDNFHVEVNSMLPQLNQNSFQQLFCQVCPVGTGCGGKGGTPETAVTLDGLMRVDNAFFQPGNIDTGMTGGIDIPGLVTPFDRLVFFQGTNRDFVYDGDVVYHEFTHAVIHSAVRNGGLPAGLNGPFFDKWGVRNEAGALNEAYADFFSQSFTNDAITGEYAAAGINMGETGIRNAGQPWDCPNSTTGEVHDDSRAWSSALWAIRTSLGGTDPAVARRMERVVFASMAMLPVNASFKAATLATRAALLAEFPGREADLDAAFGSRGMADCVRTRTAVANVNGAPEYTNIPYLQFMGKGEAGLLNNAPGHMQLRLDLPPRTRTFTVEFTSQGGGILGNFLGGGGMEDNRLIMMVKRDAPMEHEVINNRAAHDGVEITVTPDGNGNASVPVDVDPNGLAAARTYYVGFAIIADNGVTLQDIRVTVDQLPLPDAGVVEVDAGQTSGSSSSSGGSGGDAPNEGPCNCSSTLPQAPYAGALLMGALLVLFRRKR